ncbi:MAG: hypothetical protein ACE5LS_00035 [Thermoplasmata archaeon]
MGSSLDKVTANLMLERQALLVPTRFIMERLLKTVHEGALRTAIKKGVRIALGTDIS